MKNNIIRLQDIISKQLGIDSNEIKPEYDFEKHLGADSLDVVELVMLIEDEFDTEITLVQKILDYIQDPTTKS